MPSHGAFALAVTLLPHGWGAGVTPQELLSRQAGPLPTLPPVGSATQGRASRGRDGSATLVAHDLLPGLPGSEAGPECPGLATGPRHVVQLPGMAASLTCAP